MSSPFEDLGGLFGERKAPAEPPTEKGVAWQAKEIDGKLFVSVEQVVELLRVKMRRDWNIDLEELTSDWEWREAADPQKPFFGASRDRSLRGKARRRARRGKG